MTHSFRLVVADDHVLLREGIVAILESDPDFEVVAECDDGPAAVAACRSLSPDLVLMDVQMPGGDGLAAAEEILRSCPGVRVMVLTMFDLDDYVARALRMGASGFLLKATPARELLGRVKACAAGEFVAGPTVLARLVETYVQHSDGAAVPSMLVGLTDREQDVLRAMADGLSNAEIGRELYLAESTVKTHVSRILDKLGARDRVQAVVIAHRAGLAPGHSRAP
ncbi:response regulator [Tessaracoccus lubricantis]|uniref:Response regulator n=1 Tax=Tessaracoccus lubricantis TaxID=545543 RepID=A0ABP9FE15_9ACTN